MFILYRAVLFDFDGTLADTLPLLFFSFKQVFRKYAGRELSEQDILDLFGPTEDGLLEKMIDKDKLDEAAAEFYHLYEDRHAKYVMPQPEIEQILRDLKERGLRLGVFTGKGKKSAEISMKRLGLEHFFDAIITGDDVAHPKPAPDGIHQAIEQMRVSPSDIIFVGDSDADVQAARSAGVKVIAVKWLTPQTVDHKVAPDYLVKDVVEFREVIHTLGIL